MLELLPKDLFYKTGKLETKAFHWLTYNFARCMRDKPTQLKYNDLFPGEYQFRYRGRQRLK